MTFIQGTRAAWAGYLEKGYRGIPYGAGIGVFDAMPLTSSFSILDIK